MIRPLRNPWSLCNRYLEEILYAFQAVLNDRAILVKIKNHHYRNHCLLPLITTVLIFIDSWILYTYGEEGSNDYFHHVMISFMPPFFLRQGNIVFNGLFIHGLFSYGFLFVDTLPHADFILLYTEACNSIALPFRKGLLGLIETDLGKKLIEFHKPANKLVNLQVSVMAFQVNLAFTFPLCFFELYKIYSTSGQYFPSLRVIIVALIAPFYLRSLVSVVHFNIQFMYQNLIINIKQKHYLSNMNVDNKKVARKMDGEIRKRKFKNAYQEWHRMMCKLLDLTREIDAFNRFYSKYITISMFGFGLIGCAVLHTVQKSSEAPFLLTIPWIFYSCIYLLLTFLFNVSSSRIIYLNGKLFKNLRQLQIGLLLRKHLRPTQIVKLDLVNEYKLLLQKCSFRLLNSSVINNKLFFFQIFGCVSVFYMKLIPEDF